MESKKPSFSTKDILPTSSSGISSSSVLIQPPKVDNNQKKKLKVKSGAVFHFITGHEPSGSELAYVQDFLVYDVPASWDNPYLLSAFSKWGKVIDIRTKIQRKYQSIRVKIQVASNMSQLINYDIWTTLLDGITVRIYPAS